MTSIDMSESNDGFLFRFALPGVNTNESKYHNCPYNNFNFLKFFSDEDEEGILFCLCLACSTSVSNKKL